MNLIFSGRFLHMLNRFGEPLPSIPVIVHDSCGISHPELELHWLKIEAGMGDIDRTKGAFLLDRPGINRYVLNEAFGICFDPSTWNGRHIFFFGGTTIIGISSQLAQEIKNQNMRNITLIPTSEYRRWERDLLLQKYKGRYA